MMCTKPYVKKPHAFPCGQCKSCRRTRRGEWTTRMLLEMGEHSDNTFITLTYSEDREELNPKDLQDFIKRMRKHGYKFRYYAAGEYGSKTYRPHYHLIAFGLPSCQAGETIHDDTGINSRCCPVCASISRIWGKGRVQLAAPRSHQQVAAYVCGYIVKANQDKIDEQLEGLQPEFARMSTKPAIGLNAMDDIASELLTSGYLEENEDVPTFIMLDGRPRMLGSYLRRQLRKRVGRAPETPPHILEEIQKEVHDVFQDAEKNAPPHHRTLYVQTKLSYLDEQRRKNIEAREAIRKSKTHETL